MASRPGEGGWERPTVDAGAVRRVHLVAVAGVGMTALAGMFKQRGFEVSGSDEHIYPPMSVVLEQLSIPVALGFRPSNLLPRPDLVIVGNKVSQDNLEVQAVLAQGIPYLSLPEALAQFFIAGHRSLVVAGTHGKTTSTAMLAWVLECAGRDPSVMVGGESFDFGRNFKLGKGEPFVVEGDEYDSAFFDKGPKFLHYQPAAVILTGVEFDHADIYEDLAAVKVAFQRLLGLLPNDAPLVVAFESAHAMEVAAGARQASLSTYGADAAVDWGLTDLRDAGERTSFSVRRRGRDEGKLTLRAPGLINARNALGVYALARELGLTHDEIASGIASFAGVARRQERVGEFGGVTLIDDFAHHPTAVEGTLAAMRLRYPERRLWAVFEPRSNTSRRRVFQRDYVGALANADRVVVGRVFEKQTDAVAAADLFSPEELVDDLRQRGVAAWAPSSTEAIAALVADEAGAGDVVVMMSNGDFGGLRGRLAAALNGRPNR